MKRQPLTDSSSYADRHSRRQLYGRRPLGAVVAVTVMAAGLFAAPTASAGPDGSPLAVVKDAPAPAAAAKIGADAGASDNGRTITLVTGDQVRVTPNPEGGYDAVATAVPRADGSTPFFSVEAGPESTFVVPSDAYRSIEAGVLDRSLFDVTYLADHGFTDGESGTLPVIVQYPRARKAASVMTAAEALPASKATHDLDSIGGAAVNVTKAKASDFWSTIRQAPTSGPKALSSGALRAGVAKVWLDRPVTVTLDESVPLVGAPKAWEAGFDGKGTKVAVLDTGIDETHPDVAGKVTASKGFIPEEGIVDGHGHGTHVAATVAGTGDASGGLRKGVAPGADLLIGKVLDNTGSGPSSTIIEGMEWATEQEQADIVSMSLGSDPTDGTDPLSQAVNSLTDSTGALFVIAAGNAGPGASSVGAPGAADAALTVAATDKQDKLASFSSRGPRTDGALKPDISAPGVGIVAARAAGTSIGSPVDAQYTALNGTSMATPHVAGAAAILAQAHPDWTAVQLKAALMSTAKDVDLTTYEVGAGRLDVGRAATQEVVARTVNLDFGNVPFGETPAPVQRQVEYANSGKTDVTLTLSPTLRTGAGEPVDGALTSDQTITVPAGGSASATVTLDLSDVAPGTYSGSLVAADTEGTIRVTTPVGLTREPRKVNLTVHTVDHRGRPAPEDWTTVLITGVLAIDVPGKASVDDYQQIAPGVRRYRVVPGTYQVSGVLSSQDDRGQVGLTQMINPELAVPGDTDVSFDARSAVPITYDTPRPHQESSPSMAMNTVRTLVDGRAFSSMTIGTTSWTMATPTAKVTKGAFAFSNQRTFLNPQLDLRVVTPKREKLAATTGGYADHGMSFADPGYLPFPAGKQRLKLVDVNLAKPADLAGLDLKGKLALQMVDPEEEHEPGESWGCGILQDRLAALKAAGAVGIVLYPSKVAPGCVVPLPTFSEERVSLPVAQLSPSAGGKLRAQLTRGPVTLDVTSNPEVDYLYNLKTYEKGRIPGSLRYRLTDRDLAEMDSRFPSATPGQINKAWHAKTPVETFSIITASAVAAQTAKTEYYGPLYDDVMANIQVQNTNEEWTSHTRPFVEPTRTLDQWTTVAGSPGAELVQPTEGLRPVTTCTMCRQGDLFYPNYLETIADGKVLGGGLVNFNVTMTADGVAVPRAPLAPLPVPGFKLSPEPTRYRLSQSGGGTSNVWQFTSAAPTQDELAPGYACVGTVFGGRTEPCRPDPLVFAGYDLGESLRSDNSVLTGAHTFTVRAYHQPGAKAAPRVTKVNVWYSTDDGETWTSATVTKGKDGKFRVKARYPKLARTSGAVSLKVTARDAGGNTVEQTSLRAFALHDRS